MNARFGLAARSPGPGSGSRRARPGRGSASPGSGARAAETPGGRGAGQPEACARLGRGAQPGQVLPDDLLHLPVELHDQPQLVVGVLGHHRLPAEHQRQEDRRDVVQRPLQHQADHDPAAVPRVALPAHVTGLLQPVGHPGDRGRGEPGRPGQLAGRHLAAEAEDVQAVQVRGVEADPVGRGLAEELHQRARLAEPLAERGGQLLALRAAGADGLDPWHVPVMLAGAWPLSPFLGHA